VRKSADPGDFNLGMHFRADKVTQLFSTLYVYSWDTIEDLEQVVLNEL
jgi:hypothetical protein